MEVFRLDDDPHATRSEDLLDFVLASNDLADLDWSGHLCIVSRMAS